MNDCKKSAYKKDALEKLIIDTILEELKKPATMSEIVRGLLIEQERQITENSALLILQREQRQNEIALDNIMAAIERGIMNNTTNKRMKELETRQEELERLILIEQSKQAVKVTERDIRAFYEQALRLEPQMLINFLMKEIVLFDDRIEIHFNSPLRNNPDDSQGFSFYRHSKVLQRKIVIIEIFV